MTSNLALRDAEPIGVQGRAVNSLRARVHIPMGVHPVGFGRRAGREHFLASGPFAPRPDCAEPVSFFAIPFFRRTS